MWQKLAVMLEMIKFKLTVFALPFAFTGAFLAAGGVPDLLVFCWVVVAMVGARTCAMTFNRIVDRRFDAANPRTADRAIPLGAVKLGEAWLLVIAAAGIFFLACWQLNRLTLLLSPLALSLTLLYSLTKRFTALCHVILGIALSFAPLGGWVAVTGSLSGYPWPLSLGVMFWVAGFDTVYACLDAEFDRQTGLYSLPSRIGSKLAFRIAGLFHCIAFLLFAATGWLQHLNYWYFIGLAVTAGALLYQHLIVSPTDLSRINASFFSMNGLISIAIFAASWLALATSS